MLLILGLLPACATSNSQASKSDSQPQSPKITKAEFDGALSQLKIDKSEWNEFKEITGKRDGKGPDNSLSKKDLVTASIDIFIQQKDTKSDWELSVLANYMGQEWLSTSQIDVKSSVGVLNLTVDPTSRIDKPMGFASVELSVVSLSKEQSIKLCKIATSSGAKFRLSGTGGPMEAIREILPNKQLEIKNVCQVYFGIQQGFSIS